METTPDSNDKPHDGNHITYAIVAAIQAFFYSYASDKYKNNSNDQMAKWTRKLAIYTRRLCWVGLATGFLTILVLGIQACLLYRTDETQRLIQRAFIFRNGYALISEDNGRDVTDWKLTPILENSGKNGGGFLYSR